jgi:hypothetical protein
MFAFGQTYKRAGPSWRAVFNKTKTDDFTSNQITPDVIIKEVCAGSLICKTVDVHVGLGLFH